MINRNWLGSRKSISCNMIIYAALALCLFFMATHRIQAQQTLNDADWFERELGDGVIWRFYLFDNLFGSKQSVSYIDADLMNPNVSVEFPYLVSGRQLTSSMIQQQFPDAVTGINGTYFNTTYGGHVTYLRIDGTVIPPGGDLFASWGYEGALAMDASANASIIKKPSRGWARDKTHPDIMACGPLLIVNGVIPYSYLASIGSHCTSRHPRSAVGITSNYHLILLTVDGRTAMASGMTCEELAQIMAQLGCPNALNLDGGGSTTLWGDGEPYNGVLNYPSDNGVYDHFGERACSNAISIESIAPNPKTWDARLVSKTFSPNMVSKTSQIVTLVYHNIGTNAWSASDTKVVLARPDTRTSDFQDVGAWISSSQPALMNPSTVAPGETATFSFALKAPDISITTLYDEHFMLSQNGVGRIGPADSEAWMRICVQPESSGGETVIVDNDYGYPAYTETGTWATSGAPGYNEGTYRYASVGGAHTATWTASLIAGDYQVAVIYRSGTNRAASTKYVISAAGGNQNVFINQQYNDLVWVVLGTFTFNSGDNTIKLDAYGSSGGTVVIADAVSFTLASTPTPSPTPTPTPTPTPEPNLLDIIVDNDQGAPVYTETGTWTTSGSTGYNGGTYRFADAGGSHTATWNATLGSGMYQVFVFYRAGTNRATSTRYNIATASGTQTVYIDQTLNSMTWVSLGTFRFNEGSAAMTLDAAGSSGGTVVIADAVRFTFIERIVDNDHGSPDYAETGTWTTSGNPGYDGGTYRWAYSGSANNASWDLNLPSSGAWTISVIYVTGVNRCASAKFVAQTASGPQTVYIDQTQNNLTWVTLGTFDFNFSGGSVMLDALGSSGGTVVIADAVRAIKQ
ncbi:phosphodiester glycosidase family protein [Candidatus Sumerlaeota bacterium]|nr:phosphodiester glycosidase family protein [Candidatus Sumerlaeota bacterium]